MPDSATASEVLAAMITPALLISASGTLVLSTSNRLSRVVDRVRVMSRDAEVLKRGESTENHTSEADVRRRNISRQLHSLARRAILLRSAIASLYMAIGFLVTTSVSIGLLTLAGMASSWVPIALAIVGACALLFGSVQLVREGRMAIDATLEEMQYVRTVIAERPSERPAASSAADRAQKTR